MNNIVKYKLSNYKDIRPLEENEKVFLCYDILGDRRCVKKYADKFTAELYKKLKSLEIQNIPKIYEIIEYDNNFIIIEEYIKGKSIENIVNEKGMLSEYEAVKYIGDICNALKSVHKENIIHRDISPDNVIIDEKDNGFLIDFDIARESGKNKSVDTTILGTVGFASPEQFGFAQTNERSDIYSVGVLLNYMLTGHIVQEGVFYKKSVSSVIKKATEIDPNLRYNNIYEFERDLLNSIEANKNSFNYNNKTQQNLKKGKVINKIIAFIMCFLFFVTIWDSIYNFRGYKFILENFVLCGYIFVVPMWWFGNKGKIWDKLPFIRNLSPKDKRIMAITIYVVVFLALFILVPYENKN